MSDETGAEKDNATPIMKEGAAWIAEILDDPSDANLAACRAWYETSADHREAFESAMFFTPMPREIRARIEAALRKKFKSLHRSPGVDTERSERPAAEAPLQPWGPRRQATREAPRRDGRGSRINRIGWVMAASVATVALAVGVMPSFMSDLITSWAEGQHFATGHAEIRSFSLSDGTNITLDSDSRVDVKIDHRQRHAALRQGRARFIVKDDSRPFTIEAADRKVVTAQGTVDAQVDQTRRVDVRLRTGAAMVETDGHEAQPLVIDQPVIYAPEKVDPTPVVASAVDTGDWPTGWVEYRTISLGALIEQANRYARKPIILDDPRLAALQATGRFKLTDTDTFVSRIVQPFGLRMLRRADGIHLSR